MPFNYPAQLDVKYGELTYDVLRGSMLTVVWKDYRREVCSCLFQPPNHFDRQRFVKLSFRMRGGMIHNHKALRSPILGTIKKRLISRQLGYDTKRIATGHRRA